MASTTQRQEEMARALQLNALPSTMLTESSDAFVSGRSVTGTGMDKGLERDGARIDQQDFRDPPRRDREDRASPASGRRESRWSPLLPRLFSLPFPDFGSRCVLVFRSRVHKHRVMSQRAKLDPPMNVDVVSEWPLETNDELGEDNEMEMADQVCPLVHLQVDCHGIGRRGGRGDENE
jgi:hypothetical protein